MDATKLRVLLQVMEYGSITKTGEALGYSQSGITHIINNLEKEIGFRLLNRGRNGITLTREGELLYPEIREMVFQDEKLNQRILNIKGLVQGEIKIGAFTSIALYCLPDILEKFQQEHPTICISIYKGNSNEIENWLSDGTVDIGFLSIQNYHRFDFIKLLDDPICVVMPPAHPLSKQKVISLQQLRDVKFLRYSASSGLDLDTERVLLEIGPKNIVYTTNFDFSLIRMVRKNLGVCLVPGLMAYNDRDGVVIRHLDPPCYRELGIAVPRLDVASPIVKSFINCAKDLVGQLNLFPEN